MHRWKFHTTAQCPRCHDPLEDKSHILQCPALAAAALWITSISHLKQWLQEQMAHPTLVTDLISGLQQWYEDDHSPRQPLPQWQQEQHDIGWESVFDGWVSLQWRSEQDQYWSQICSRKLSKWWTLELIKKLWDIVWDMWEHQNEVLHHDPENWMSILESVVNDKIWQFYAISMASLPRNAMGFLALPLEEQLLKPLTTKTLWVESIKAAILCKARHNYGAMMGEQQLMQQFLGLD